MPVARSLSGAFSGIGQPGVSTFIAAEFIAERGGGRAMAEARDVP